MESQAVGWDWNATATIIQAIATLVALFGVAITFVLTRRGQKQDRDHAERAERSAEASAERSENAAALTIDNMTRIADAVEALSVREFKFDATLFSPEAVEKVAWDLSHFQGDAYLLTNTGNATAFSVQISAHKSLMTPGELPDRQDLRPGEAIKFMAARSMGTTDSTITVEWSNDEPESERDVWRYPLPPRPPRR